MIEVFRTNVIDPKQAKFLKDQVVNRFNGYEISFDLEDCDRILRVKSQEGLIQPDQIIKLFNEFGFMAQVLPEDYPRPVLHSLIRNIPVNNCW